MCVCGGGGGGGGGGTIVGVCVYWGSVTILWLKISLSWEILDFEKF